MDRVTAILLFGCIAYAQAQNAVAVSVEGVTPTQAVFSYVPPDTAACTVKAVTADDTADILPDTDPILFPGADQDLARPSTTVQNNRRYVVIGSRTSDKATDGKLYSRALQAATSHLLIVQCGTARGVAAFDTKNPPLGSTYPEIAPFNPAGFGNYGWPTIDWTDRSKTYVDPVTGLLLRPAIGVSPQGQSGQWGNDPHEWQFTDVFDLNHAWSSPDNILSGNSNGPFATYSGLNKDPLFLPFPTFPDYRDGTIAGWYPTSPIWDDARLTLYGSGSGSAEDRKVLVCLGVFFQPGANQCVGQEIELTLPTTPGSVSTPGFPAFQFKSWQIGRYLTKEEASVPYGTVTVVNSAVTLTDGQSFPLSMPAGVKIKIGTAWYTVQSVQDARHLQLQEPALSVGPVPYVLGAFGVRVRKKTATGKIDVAASWTLGWSREPEAPLTGATDFCSRLTFQVDYEADGITPMNPPKLGQFCILGNHDPVLILLIPSTGETRFLSPLHHQDAGSTTSPRVPLGAFSETDPFSLIGYHGDDEVQSGMALYRITYDPSTCHFRAFPGNAYGFSSTVPSDCVTWKNLSPNSKGKGIVDQFQAKAASNPFWDPAAMSAMRPDFSAISGNYAIFTQFFGGPQNSPCFMATFDLSTGDIVRVVDSFGGAPDLRWAGCHTTPSVTSGKWIGPSLSLLTARNDKGYLGGPFKIRSLDQLSKDGGQTWSNDTTLHAAEAGVCTTTDPAMIAKGATGPRCVKVRISSDYPCNLSPANGDVAKYPCPWDPTLSGPMPLQPGDYISILPPNGIDGKKEKLLITSKTPIGGGNWEVELMRWATCDTSEYFSHITAPYVAEHPKGWDAYMTGTGLCGGDVVWFDASGQDPAFYPDTSNITGRHLALGPAPNGDIAEVAEGAVSRIGPIPGQFGGQISFAMNLFGTTFGGVSVDSNEYLQSYPNVGQWTATADRKAFAFDLRHYNPSEGTRLEAPSSIFQQNYSLVPGMSQVYRIDNYGGVFGKIYPYLAFAGPYLLKDMSGPQSLMSDKDEFRFCVAYKNGECVPGSKVYDAFVNLPRVSRYNAGHCFVNTYAEINPCFTTPLDFSSYAIQFKFTEDDPKGVKRRRLTSGFTGPGAQYQYSNTHVTPGGEWAFVGPGWVNGVRPGLMLVKIPPPPVEDGVDRTSFIPIPVQVSAGTTAPPSAFLTVAGGTGQSTIAGTAFGAALQAKVLDGSLNPVAGVTVTFAASGSGASATFNGNPTAAVSTNALGIATSPVPVANATAGGPYTVTATVAGFSPVSFSLTNLPVPGIGLTVSPKTIMLGPSGQQALTAVVTGTANTAVTWSLSPNTGTISGNTYTAPSTIASTQAVTLTATSLADSNVKDTATIILRPPDITIFAPNSAPATCNGIGSGTELGVKFRSDTSGLIRGIRFYKSAFDSTPHSGTLWNTTGVALATGTFSNETASGWQTLIFATPVTIAANTTYVASYYTSGWYCASAFAFWSGGVDNAPLHALKDGVDGPNGVYATNSTGGIMPAQPYVASNYWVDVLFTPAPPQTPASVTVVTGTPQSTPVGASFGAALQARVLDTLSLPVAGVTVTFAAPGTGASTTFNGSTSTTAVTDASGVAISPVPKANATPGGPFAVTATVIGLTPAQFMLTNTPPPPPASVAVAGGTGQSAVVGTPFGAALQAKVLDASSNPLAGVTVTFAAVGSGASATFNGSASTTALTNASGIATSPVPVANATAGGPYAMTATVAGLSPASFSLTNLPVPSIVVTVSPKTVTLGPSEQRVFTAAVTGTGNTAVSWSLSPNTGTLTGNTYTAPFAIASTQTVTLTATSAADGSTKDTATITLRPADATIFAANSAPSACNGSGSGTELGVKFRSDKTGSIRGVRFYKSALDTSSHTGTLWNTAGVALATGDFINETASGWQTLIFATPVTIAANTTYVASYHTNSWYCASVFAFSSAGVDNPPLHALKDGVDGPNGVYAANRNGGVMPAQPFVGSNYWVDVLFTAAPQIPGSITAVNGTPQSAQAGTSFSTALQARVLDTSSNPIPGATVTFSAPGAGASATFNGSVSTTASTDASGIATSPVPVANATPGGPYTVTATVGGLPAAQYMLANTQPAQPASIAASIGTPQSTIVGTPFGAALQAKVLDASSNPVAGVTVTFAAPVSGASATFNGTASTTVLTNASGIATSPVPVANATVGGPYTVTATVTGFSPVSFSLTNLPLPGITVVVSPKTVTLGPSGQQSLTATVQGTGNTAVTWSWSPNLGTMSGNTYTAPSTIASIQTVTLTATSVVNSNAKDTATITLRPPDVTIFPATSAPTTCNGIGSGTELGLKFRSDTSGLIRGIRFYKSAFDNTPHSGTLWNTAGAALATGTFSNETASGWQTLIFATPVAIVANTTYVASYYTSGWYCASAFAFSSAGVDNAPLHALKDGMDGPNGVYATSSTGGIMPDRAFVGSNYWVDVLFSTTSIPPGSNSAVNEAPQSKAAKTSSGTTLQVRVAGTPSTQDSGTGGVGTNARVRFGYAENGPPDSFYCTSRQEACVTDERVTPFAYEQSDALSPTPCASGCTIQVPAISGRVLYYRIESVDGSGHVTYQGPRMVVAVP